MPTALKFSDHTPAFWGLYVKKISQAVCILEVTKCRIKRKDDCSVFNLKYVYILIVDRLENLSNSVQIHSSATDFSYHLPLLFIPTLGTCLHAANFAW